MGFSYNKLGKLIIDEIIKKGFIFLVIIFSNNLREMKRKLTITSEKYCCIYE